MVCSNTLTRLPLLLLAASLLHTTGHGHIGQMQLASGNIKAQAVCMGTQGLTKLRVRRCDMYHHFVAIHPEAHFQFAKLRRVKTDMRLLRLVSVGKTDARAKLFNQIPSPLRLRRVNTGGELLHFRLAGSVLDGGGWRRSHR